MLFHLGHGIFFFMLGNKLDNFPVIFDNGIIFHCIYRKAADTVIVDSQFLAHTISQFSVADHKQLMMHLII